MIEIDKYESTNTIYLPLQGIADVDGFTLRLISGYSNEVANISLTSALNGITGRYSEYVLSQSDYKDLDVGTYVYELLDNYSDVILTGTIRVIDSSSLIEDKFTKPENDNSNFIVYE